MRHILVPTDFSAAADNALEYARLLATEFSAAITLAYVHSMPLNTTGMGDLSNELYEEGEAAVKERAAQLITTGLQVNVRIQLGIPSATLISVIEEDSIDLVVMGCQGENYLPVKFFGSTTTDLMVAIAVPIIAVPIHFTPKLPEKIMWATDLTPPDKIEALFPVAELVARAGTPLMVFHHQEFGGEKLPDKAFSKLLNGISHEYFNQVADGDKIDRAILNFIASSACDLAVFIHRDSTWFSRLIVPSRTRRALWSSPVPVMILQD